MKKILFFILLSIFNFKAIGQGNVSYNAMLRNNTTYPGQTLANICGYWANGKEYALLGASKGMIVTDISNPDIPKQIVQLPGPNNLWKEIKTYKNFAYVTSEGGQGLQIVDMKKLPTANLDYKFYTGDGALTGKLNAIHALHIDTLKGVVYLFGCSSSLSNGAIMLDIKTDPYNPKYLGTITNGSGNTAYIHDGFAHNDTLYAGHIYRGEMEVYYTGNKTKFVSLGKVQTPTKFTHNIWLSKNHKYALTTDENNNSVLAAYDVSDLSNIKLLDQHATNPSSGAIIHNTHIINDFAVNSYYTEGINIVDAHRPDNLVEVARYDSYSPPTNPNNPFEGAWGVFPFFPSGTIVISNINEGLYIVSPKYKRACYLEGNVKAKSTGQLLSNVSVKIDKYNLAETLSNIKGDYKTGVVDSGKVTVTFSKIGYKNLTTNAIVSNGKVTILNVEMELFTLTFPYCNNVDDGKLPMDWSTAGNIPVEIASQNTCTSRGSNIIRFNSFSSTNNVGNTATVLLKEIDLSTNANFSNLTFSVAAKKTFYCDTWKGLKVEVSKDFGQTWSRIYNKTDAYTITTNCGAAGQCPCTTASAEELATVSGTAVPTAAFSPKNCQEWRDEKIDLTSFVGSKILIRFVMYSDFSFKVDNIYIDDVCVNKIACSSVAANILGNTTFCEGTNTILTASGGTSYKWSTGITKDNITITKAGTYSVTVTDINGCTAVGTKVVSTFPYLKIEIKGDSSFCIGSSTTLIANGGDQYIWSSGEKTPSISINVGGVYTVTATNSNGCAASLSKTIIVKSKPNATLSGTNKICEGDSTKLSTVNSSGNTYLWSNGEKKSSIIVKKAGNYSVSITNDLGCTVSNSIAITVNPTPNITIIQNGNQLTATGGNSYLWSSGETKNVVTCSKSGTYTVTATDSKGCIAIKSINIALLSIEENQENIAFQIFPNPNNGIFQIVKNSNLEGIEAHIYNGIGQLIQKEILTKNTTNINIGTNNKGVLYLYLIEKNKNIYQQKIIVE